MKRKLRYVNKFIKGEDKMEDSQFTQVYTVSYNKKLYFLLKRITDFILSLLGIIDVYKRQVIIIQIRRVTTSGKDIFFMINNSSKNNFLIRYQIL